MRFTRRKVLFFLLSLSLFNAYIYLVLYNWLQDHPDVQKQFWPWEKVSCYKNSKLPAGVLTSRIKAKRDVPNTCISQVAVAADLKMLEVLRAVRFTYPKFKMTLSGFMQPFDAPPLSAAFNMAAELNVFVLPHSHNDPGWLYTAEAYYRSNTKSILNTMVNRLTQNSDEKFIWAEMFFLHKWMSDASGSMRQKLIKLVRDGRFEIGTGGWVMPDEASTTVYSLMTNLIEGHEWINQTFGRRVTSGWSIDPFGHSATVPYLLELSGLKNAFIQRTHFAVKRYFAHKQHLQFYWRQQWGKPTGSLLTQNHPFLSYAITYSCGPDPSVCCQFDFEKRRCSRGWGKSPTADPITTENVKSKADLLTQQLRQTSTFFKGKNILLLHGDDFRYETPQAADSQLNNMRSLMNYINWHSTYNIKIRFGTLTEYFDAVRRDGVEKPSLTGDFYPYSDRGDQHWSGVYTSRPWLKATGRRLEYMLRTAELMTTHLMLLKNLTISKEMSSMVARSLRSARRELALFQHHDAITGTAKATVVKDYYHRLFNGIQQSASVIKTILTSISRTRKQQWKLINEWRNVNSEPEIHTISTSAASTVVAVYNSLVRRREALVRLRIEYSHLSVHDEAGETVHFQLNPVISYDGNIMRDVFELVFLTELEPLQLLQFTIHKNIKPLPSLDSLAELVVYNSNTTVDYRKMEVSKEEEAVLKNSKINAVVASCNGMLQYTYEVESGMKHSLRTSLVRYTTGSSYNPFRDKSGAYIFLPDGAANDLETSRPRMLMIQGSIVHELYVFTDHVTITYSLVNYVGSESEALYITTKTNLNSLDNIEVALRVNTHLKNTDGDFYTDSNSFQTMRRERLLTLPLQGQFYPMTSWSWLDDGLSRLTLVAAQPHAVTSLATGELEVVLDRRLMQDDWRGLNQGVMDNRPTTANFAILLEKRQHKEQLIGKVPRLSPKSVHVVDLLNNPALSVVAVSSNQVTAVSSNHVAPLTQPISSALSWPCYTNLVLSRPGEQFRSVRLLLQTVATDCTFEQTTYFCSSNHSVNVTHLFGIHFKSYDVRRFLASNDTVNKHAKIANWILTDLELSLFENAPV